jgi:hypothetical protein
VGEFASPGTSAGSSVASASGSGASGKSDGEDDAGADDETDGFNGRAAAYIRAASSDAGGDQHLYSEKTYPRNSSRQPSTSPRVQHHSASPRAEEHDTLNTSRGSLNCSPPAKVHASAAAEASGVLESLSSILHCAKLPHSFSVSVYLSHFPHAL